DREARAVRYREEPTTNVDPVAMSGVWLDVLVDGLYAKHRLPETGTVVLGRSSEADVCIDHRSLSRKHAILQVSPELHVEDLGSVNGTFVRGRRLAPGAR